MDVNKSDSSEEVKAGQVPSWLNKDFVEETLRKKEPEVRLESCEVREATKLGDNYSTIVYRAIATLDDGRSKKIIFKCLPSNEMRRKFANSLGVFTKEINVYERLLPIYEKMHREKMGPEEALPWPKCYHTLHDGLRDFIALEDFEPLGFRMGERKTGLSEKELKLALKSLGQFHAYSIAYRLEDPESFEADVKNKFFETFFLESALETMKPFFLGCLQAMQNLLRSWKEPKYDSVADHIHDLEDTFLTKLSAIALEKDEDTAVICHGDFWVNNFLFRYEEEPCDFKFLDFQVVRHASPALDLLYLMVTSVNAEVRRNYWKQFLKDIYLTSLGDTLQKLGHPLETKADSPFSWKWLQKELASKEFFAFAISVTTTAVLADPEDVFNMDNLTEESVNDMSPLMKLTRGKNFQERFKGLTNDFIASGFFH